ncbi:TetR/AcrR family transcriptional regulator [Crossiella cryophila]|uniref:AcrR family transcriptional regulator n=1 Tax=Crossiella cryophila TaxID=43355 RepID=A0A7W7FR68_9PSEU|nr:TetR/AcrR family transcriptional regulator [Crossiella cryophila]MBB4675651.1 AcrR family transcriptional regulator [Crossiella cryophila]
MNDRRERFREQTIAEVKEHALAQVAEAGATGVSVNAIAKRMGVTGPALYRYFASRDALLTALISDAYHDLADTVTEATTGAAGQRARAYAAAFRGWALAQPHRYLLLFGTPVPGYQAPADTIAAANRAMTVLLTVFDDTERKPGPDLPGQLQDELAAWAARAGHGGRSPAELHWALTAWSRLHGLVSLEVTGQFGPMGITAGALYEREVDELVAELPG